MKTSTFSTRLNLKKETISQLNLSQIKGGDVKRDTLVRFTQANDALCQIINSPLVKG